MTTVTITRSGMITQLAYDESSKRLTLTFAKGGTYHYSDVPKSQFEAMLNSESVGKHYHAHIKGKYTHEKSDD
jgi:YD repeat-containing protein